jgi:pimeloyl-ACP methyl ester carboxylesterase
MDRAAVGEVELCYELIGPAGRPVVLLVAGLGRQLIGWDDAFCGLLVSAGYQVLRFDNRDVGLSTRFEGAPAFDPAAAAAGRAPYTLEDMAGDAAGLLDALGIADAHVVGTSMGGMIAQSLAIGHPGRVRSLCSIMSTTGAPGVGLPTAEAMAVVTTSPPRERDAYVAFELANSEVIGSRGGLVDEDWRRRRFTSFFDRGLYPAGVGRQIMAIVASGDRTEGLSSVRAPTVVIHGDVDTLVAPSGGEATARAVPGAELLVIPDMGHEIPPATWPEVVGAIVANARRAGAHSASAPDPVTT